MPLPNFLYISLIINRILAKRRVFPTSPINARKLRFGRIRPVFYGARGNRECLWNKERLLNHRQRWPIGQTWRCRLQLLRDRFFQLVELYVKIFKTVSNLRENSQHAGPSFGLFARLNLHVLDPPALIEKHSERRPLVN